MTDQGEEQKTLLDWADNSPPSAESTPYSSTGATDLPLSAPTSSARTFQRSSSRYSFSKKTRHENAQRLLLLSDAVYSIIATIMVLPLMDLAEEPEEPPSTEDLKTLWGTILWRTFLFLIPFWALGCVCSLRSSIFSLF